MSARTKATQTAPQVDDLVYIPSVGTPRPHHSHDRVVTAVKHDGKIVTLAHRNGEEIGDFPAHEVRVRPLGSVVKNDIVVALDASEATYLMDQSENGPTAVAARKVGVDYLSTSSYIGSYRGRSAFYVTFEVRDAGAAQIAMLEGAGADGVMLVQARHWLSTRVGSGMAVVSEWAL